MSNDWLISGLVDKLDNFERRLSSLERPLKHPLYASPVKGDIAERWVFNGKDWVTRYSTFKGEPSYQTWLIMEKSAQTVRAQALYMAENRIAWDKFQSELKRIEDFK